MTIAIAASGPNAGRAAYEALKAVERVARGSIGGFAVFAAIDREDRLHRAESQRGGSATLFIEGERCGVPPPDAAATAPAAALISSGPDRPEPLAQFLVGEPGAGLVTGHRLPNSVGTDGQAINLAVLGALSAGRSASEAVDDVLDANPEADAGIIALDREGGLYARNSARVERRPDLGRARREDPSGSARVEVLHNAILPGPSIAALAAEVALWTMVGQVEPDGAVIVPAGVPVVFGPQCSVLVDDDLVAVRVVTTDRALLDGRRNGAAIYLGAEVRQGERLLGLACFEPNVVLEDGRILSMSGQTRLRLGYRKA